MFKTEIVTFRSILFEKGYPTLKCSIEQLWVLKQRQRVSEIQQYWFLGHRGDKAASVVGFVDLLRDKSNKLDLHDFLTFNTSNASFFFSYWWLSASSSAMIRKPDQKIGNPEADPLSPRAKAD